ncbi:NACHT domain-containing protein [Streptomyces sp. NPDC002550]
MRYQRQAVWAIAVIFTGAVIAVAAYNKDLLSTPKLTAVLGFVVSVIGLVRSAATDSGAAPASAERLERYGDQLAAAVAEQWQAEWRLRRLQDPHPLQVSWTAAEPWLTEGWDTEDDASGLSDRLQNVAAAFDRVPSKRLVVLGGPGSGKTVLAVRFTLDLLRTRRSGDPVPVIFSLANWQPNSQSLQDWMTASLKATYSGATWARELLRAKRVLPVLDGLDEIPEPLRGHALRQLNAEIDADDPVLLTCRTDVYVAEVEKAKAFTSAAVVELQPLPFEESIEYLVRTAPPVRGPKGQRITRWDPLIARLRANPDDPVGRALREVLAQPLMVAMARSVYEQGDPAELIEPRFADPSSLEQHLLRAFVPAAFRDTPYADEAQRWLGFLARHLDRQNTQDLAWWRLYLALPAPLRRLGPILLLGGVTLVLSLATVPLTGRLLPVVVAALFIGASVGYALFPQSAMTSPSQPARRERFQREVLLGLGATAFLGALVGSTGSISFPWHTSMPLADHLGVNSVAMALTGGMAAAMVLAVIGITGDPEPATTSFGRRGRAAIPSAPRRVLTTIMLALFALAAVLGALAWGLNQRSTVPAMQPDMLTVAGIALVVAVACSLLTLVLTLRSRRTAARGAGAGMPAPRRPSRQRRRMARIVARRATTGVLAGLCFGVTFGLAEATALAVRANQQADFPPGSVVHRLPDGTRYGVTPNGWRHGRLPDGAPHARPPGAVHGVEVTDPDGTRYAATASSAPDLCIRPARCTPFYGPVEIRRSHSTYDGETVRLPNGTVVADSDFQNLLPPQSQSWFYQGSPSQLFSDATAFGLWTGLAIGMISGLATGLHLWLVAPVDITRVLSPQASLYTDRSTSAARGLIVCFFGVAVTVAMVGLLDLPEATDLAIVIWALAGPLALALSAWGWYLSARLWLSGTGRLPWRLTAFLQQSRRHGVLRQSGAVYQFRHRRLQEQLSSDTDMTASA